MERFMERHPIESREDVAIVIDGRGRIISRRTDSLCKESLLSDSGTTTITILSGITIIVLTTLLAHAQQADPTVWPGRKPTQATAPSIG
jgi:hypothetical protein